MTMMIGTCEVLRITRHTRCPASRQHDVEQDEVGALLFEVVLDSGGCRRPPPTPRTLPLRAANASASLNDGSSSTTRILLCGCSPLGRF